MPVVVDPDSGTISALLTALPAGAHGMESLDRLLPWLEHRNDEYLVVLGPTVPFEEALAVSDRTSEKEYFGNNAYFCDPGNVKAIREAVVQAYRNHSADEPKRARLIEQFRTRFTWRNAAATTVSGYEAAMARRRQRAAA